MQNTVLVLLNVEIQIRNISHALDGVGGRGAAEQARLPLLDLGKGGSVLFASPKFKTKGFLIRGFGLTRIEVGAADIPQPHVASLRKTSHSGPGPMPQTDISGC